MGCASSTSRDGAAASPGEGPRSHDVADVMPSATPMRLQRVKTNPMDEYDDVAAIGAGGFSVVRKVRHKQTTETYAMKIIGVKADDDETEGKGENGKERMSISEVTSEIDILRVLKSPNVLRLKEVSWFGDNVYVVTELLQGGAVLDAILGMKDERYTEAEAKLVIQRTLLGIDFMHKNFVLHRDLKLENLLLRSSEDLNSVVIADFGLARRCQQPKGMSALPHVKGIDTAPVGTPVFAAPEVVEQRSYGGAVDMWSLGVIAYVLLTGAMPRSLWKSALKYRRITEQDFGFDCFEWDSVSNAGREFVMSCLAYKPIHRLSAANCLKHEWLRKVEDVRPSPLRIKSKLRDFAKGMKLPLKSYKPGDTLIRQGERATDDVFLIKSGAVRIMVSPLDDEGNILRDQATQVATREPGEFIGEMALGNQMIAKSKSSSHNVVENRVKAILARGPPSRSRHEQMSLNSWVAARIAAKKWIGGRRNADVIARTEVTCLVMGRREMAWALAADPDVGKELQRSMSQRRQELEKLSRSNKE